MPDTLYVAWQDGATRRWHTIARLQKQGEGYEFVFTKGISGLTDLARQLFGMNGGDVYKFRDLIPLFKNRMLPTNRADYKKIADWVGILPEDDEFSRLCKLGLIPGTDSMLLYAAPEMVGIKYKLNFFVHAIRHMHEDAKLWCANVSVGSKLCPLLDVQNKADPDAVALKCPDENVLVGYVPAFYAHDLKTILSNEECARHAEILISKNNKEAPEQLKLMCEVSTYVPHGFVPLGTHNHEPHLRADAQISDFHKWNDLAFAVV